MNKSCANPWLFMGPLPWAKAASWLALTGTLSAQLPGLPDTMDHPGLEQHKDIFPHKQHAGECGCPQDGGNECPTACVQYQGSCLVSTDPGWAPVHIAQAAPGCLDTV